MTNGFTSNHWNDQEGRPAGGCTSGMGFTISWQNGPLGRDSERIHPNGAFVEDVIAAALDRLEYYQAGRFMCGENSEAIASLNYALKVLAERTADREARRVEGTHAV